MAANNSCCTEPVVVGSITGLLRAACTYFKVPELDWKFADLGTLDGCYFAGITARKGQQGKQARITLRQEFLYGPGRELVLLICHEFAHHLWRYRHPRNRIEDGQHGRRWEALEQEVIAWAWGEGRSSWELRRGKYET